MKDTILRMFRKAALPAMLAAALAIPVGAMAAEHGGHYSGGGHAYGGGHSGGEHAYGGGHFGGGPAYGGSYRGDHDFDRGYRGGYYRGGGWGGGVYFGEPYGYGYGYAAPAPCGYYDQFGNWIATACPVY